MKKFPLLFLLALAGCGPYPMSNDEIAAAVKQCKALDLKPRTWINGWDGTVVRIQCEPKT